MKNLSLISVDDCDEAKMKIYFFLALGLLFAVAYSLPVEEDQQGNMSLFSSHVR